MADEIPTIRPLRLIELFNRVPEVAELVVRELHPHDTQILFERTDPALTAFAEGPGGGFDRLWKITWAGHRERKRIRRLPDWPRLLVEEWRARLMGKRLIEEDEKGDDTVISSHLTVASMFFIGVFILSLCLLLSTAILVDNMVLINMFEICDLIKSFGFRATAEDPRYAKIE